VMAISQNRQILLNPEDDPDGRILEEFADFWKIPYRRYKSNQDEHVILTTGKRTIDKGDSDPIIVSPSGLQGFREIAERLGVQVASKNALIRLPVAPNVNVSIRTDVQQFSGSQVEPILMAGETSILSKIIGTNIHLLSVDLAREYRRLVLEGFEDTPSKRFRIASRLPLSYQSIPQFLRNMAFRSPEGLDQLTEDKIGPVECLRTILLASLVLVSGPIPRIRFWRAGKKFVLVVTHDIETRDGLERGSSQLLQVEQRLGIRSTWNIPSDRYPLSGKHLVRLAESGEIGAHDTKHDGRIVFLKEDVKISRLGECKKSLEHASGASIQGFRAPLLQHNSNLVSALAKSGYEYDSSTPSWEPLSPTSFHSHGVGTIFPFEIEGILEIPVSLPQDHQMIRVAGLSPPETVEQLTRISDWISGLGGACVLLVHPDYEFGMTEHEADYRRLLEHLSSDPKCDLMTLGGLAKWWRHRERARIEVIDGRVTSQPTENETQVEQFQTELITGYGKEGFTTDTLS
jgi:hypothetical protein